MADIDVVPKHRSNAWIWIVAAIIVICLLIWAFSRSRTTAELQHPVPAQLAMSAGGMAGGSIAV